MPDLASSELIDNPQALELFADGLAGLFLHNGTVRLTLEAIRADHRSDPASINRAVVGRLVMPAGAGHNTGRAILDFVEQHTGQLAASSQPDPQPAVPPSRSGDDPRTAGEPNE